MSSTEAAETALEQAQHKHEGYNLPTPADALEGQRLDLQHEQFRITFGGKLFFSPVTNPQAILDIGCGTSIWGMEVAGKYPQASVMGMDVNNTQLPNDSPQNYRFQVASFEEDWPLQSPLDFVHGRMIIVAIRNHRKVIEQAYKYLRPGGWFELQDVQLGPGGVVEDGPPLPAVSGSDTGFMDWNRYHSEGSAKLGVDMNAALKWPAWLETAGFVNISHQMYKWPLGPWSEDPQLKTLGEMTMQALLKGLEGFSTIVFTKGLGWSQERLQEYLGEVRKEITKCEHRYYLKVHVIYAQKPEDK